MLTIRDMRESDESVFLGFALPFYQSPALLSPVEREAIDRTFREALRNDGLLRGLILEWEGAAAGFAFLTFAWTTERGGRVVWVEDLFVSPAFRGKNIGTEFFRWLESEYQHSAKRFSLEVSPTNPAQRLYARLGFEPLHYTRMIKEVD
ncbi:MAG: GNAT family N-acetyltransferase [Planctomycetia bacterium]|nr:GNAT family N-acetyltransferase [Planctomycetia bacterium]